MAALPHGYGGADRTDPARREDEPEVARGGVEVVLDDVRQQNLDRTHEREVGDRR